MRELRWIGIGHFHTEDYKIPYSGQEVNKSNGVAIICGKSVSLAILGYNPVCDRIISVRIHGRPINMIIIHVCIHVNSR